MSESQASGGAVAPAPQSSTPAPAGGASNDAPTPERGSEGGVPDFKQAKHKVKVNGTEAEIAYDELVRGYQSNQASQQRFQEAQRLQQEAQRIKQDASAITDALEKGDKDFLVSRLGPQKAREIFETYLIEQMEEDRRPPHEKELRAEKARREALEKQIKDQEQSQQRQRYQELEQKAYEDIDGLLAEALKVGGKKPNPRLALRILEQHESELKANGQFLPPDKLWTRAQAGIKEDIALIAPDMSYQEAKDLFGESVLDRWMSEKVGQVMDSRSRPAQKRFQPDTTPPPKVDTALSLDDKFARLEQNIGKSKRR